MNVTGDRGELEHLRAENVRLLDLAKHLAKALGRAADRINALEHGSTQPKSDSRSKFVYFIAKDSGAIKIGISHNPLRRLGALQTAVDEPLRLLGMIPGGHKQEGDLHDRFRHLRIRSRGEWFRPGPDLIGYINSVCSS